MYLPDHFAEARPEELTRIIREHPLGVLITHDAEGLDANHIPFEFDPGAGAHGLLTAHVARATPSKPIRRRATAAATTSHPDVVARPAATP